MMLCKYVDEEVLALARAFYLHNKEYYIVLLWIYMLLWICICLKILNIHDERLRVIYE